MPNDINDLNKSVADLSKFAQRLETRIEELKQVTGDRSVEKHRKTLEKLLTSTNKILKKESATEQEVKDLDKLIASSEVTARTVELQHKSDKEFREDFKKSRRRLTESLEAIPESLRTLSQTATVKDVGATSSAFLTGPFGAIFKQTAADIKETSSSLVSKIKGDGGDAGESAVKGSYARGISSIADDGIYKLHRNERVVPADDNERLSDFLDSVQRLNLGGTSNMGDDGPVDVTMKANDPGIEDYFNRIVDSVSRNTTQIYGAVENIGSKIVENLQVVHALLSNVGSDLWGNQLIVQAIWWKRFNKHPVLNTIQWGFTKLLPAIFSPLTVTLKALTGGLFGRKQKSVEEESLIALRNIQRLLEGRDVQSDVGGFRKFFRSITDIPGIVGRSGISRAQKLEERRAAGGTLSKREEKIIERNIDFITRKQTASIGGNAAVSGELIRNIDDNVEMMTKTQMGIKDFQEDSFKMSQKQQKQLLDRANEPDWLKSLLQDIKNTFAAAGDAGKKGGGLLGGLFRGIGRKLKTAFTVGLSVLGSFLAKAGPWLKIAARFAGGIGLAFAGGGLIGKYIVTPLIEEFDKFFKTDVLGFIGNLSTRMIAFFEENIPGFKKLFGSEASETIRRQEALGAAKEIGFSDFSPVKQREINAKRRELGLPELIAAVEKQTKVLQDKQFKADNPNTPSKGGVEDTMIAIQGQGS